jgi:hypothetical protein
MDGQNVWVWVVVAAVVLLVLGIGLLLAGRRHQRRRTAALRRRFGPEYERVVGERGRRRGEAELRARMRRRQELPIRSLDASERQRFETAWQSAQSTWVETPAAGLRDADMLVVQVMRERGYPVANVEERAKLLSVDHADQVEQVREAHRLATAEDGTVDNEEIRHAIVAQRQLFFELLEGGEPERTRRL